MTTIGAIKLLSIQDVKTTHTISILDDGKNHIRLKGFLPTGINNTRHKENCPTVANTVTFTK